MPIGQMQKQFVRMVADLIIFAYDNGYELSFGDAWARSGHAAGSYHYKRLAIDLNLFKDGRWLKLTEDHLPLGEYWESNGGTWGGRFKSPDGNHYSYGE